MLAKAREGGYARRVSARRIIIVMVVATLASSACTSSKPDATVPTFTLPPPPTESPSASPQVLVVGDCRLVPEAVCPGAQITLVSIRGVDLHGANMQTANFRGSDLREVDFTGAILIRADFSDTDMSRAKLTGADLSGAKLKDANLTGTDLTGAKLKESQLKRTRLCKTILPDGTKDDSSCEAPVSPSPTPASPSVSASPKPSSKPIITKMAAPESVVCPSSPKDAVKEVTIAYSVTDATTVEFLIDGEDPGAQAGLDPKRGRATLDFVCNKASHKYTLVATGKSGKSAKSSDVVYRT